MRLAIALESNMHSLLRQGAGHSLAPLDHNRRGVKVEVEVIPFLKRTNTVGINVSERCARLPDTHFTCQHEGRAGDRLGDPHSAGQTLRDRRLSGSQVSLEHDDVPWFEK